MLCAQELAMDEFRVGYSAAFRRNNGSWNFPGFDPHIMDGDARLKAVALKNGPVISPTDLLGLDGLILAGETLPAETLQASETLCVVARFGVGYDKVDVHACSRADVALCTTPDAVRRPVAVAALTLVLSLAGRLLVKDQLVREGPSGFARRSDYMGVGLTGRTLASVGLGNIGLEMFRLATPFGMRHIAFDPFADRNRVAGSNVALVDLDTVFREADFLALHCPLTADTYHLVNEKRLAMMKPTAFLVNTSRGPVVDQTALEEALLAGIIAGAGLDVFDPEPPPSDARILQMPNTILTPHALSWTDESFTGIGAACVDAVRAVSVGHVPRHVVNRDVLYHPGFRRKIERHLAAASPE